MIRSSYKRPMFIRFAGLGDALFVNTIAYYYYRENARKVWIGSNKPVIFYNNPGVRIFPSANPKHILRGKIIMQYLGIIDHVVFMNYQPDRLSEWRPLEENILNVLSKKVGLQQYPERPVIFLTESEIISCRLETSSKAWVAMHSIGVTEMTENKNWGYQKFQQVSKQIKKLAKVVQIGNPDDPPLDCDLDLRGKTNPRQAAAVLKYCNLLICQEGYLMHAAAAVGTPSLVIYGGFISPKESGYKNNLNMYTQLECSPCWLVQKCPIGKICMEKISVDAVVSNALEYLHRA